MEMPYNNAFVKITKFASGLRQFTCVENRLFTLIKRQFFIQIHFFTNIGEIALSQSNKCVIMTL